MADQPARDADYALDEDELDRLRILAQEHVGCICSGPIYPSEVIALLDEIDRLSILLLESTHG